MNLKLLQQYTTETSDGYLGAIKTVGSKSHEYLNDATLSKNIKQALQGVLAPELNKSDVSVRKESYSMGRSIYVTLRLDKSKYAPTRDEYKAIYVKRVQQRNLNWIHDGYGKQVRGADYSNMDDNQRRMAEEETAEMQAKWQYDIDHIDINQYHIDKENMLNEDGKELVSVANRVIKAYNYDDSNAQVDYFDTNFYYTIRVEWK